MTPRRKEWDEACEAWLEQEKKDTEFMKTITVSEAGRLGGKKTSERKAAASRRNALKGGAPKGNQNWKGSKK